MIPMGEKYIIPYHEFNFLGDIGRDRWGFSDLVLGVGSGGKKRLTTLAVDLKKPQLKIQLH